MKTELVKIVGVSAAGKSTLVEGLRQFGYNARPVAQEHSEVPDMWQRIRPPNWLIFLDADLPAQGERRPDVSWSERWRRTELQEIVRFLRVNRVKAASGPLSELPRTGSVWTHR